MRIMINDCTVCMAKAERGSLIRRKEEEDHWLFTLCWVPVVCVCVCASATCSPVSVCTCEFVYLTDVCVARRGRWCQYELAGTAAGRPNNRLQQVRGAFNTSKHTGRAAHWCQIRKKTSHTDQRQSEGSSKLISCCAAFCLGRKVFYTFTLQKTSPWVISVSNHFLKVLL